MKKLKVTVPCTAWYESQIEVPDDMTLADAVKYAEEHIGEISVTKLHWETNASVLDPEKCCFAREESAALGWKKKEGSENLFLDLGERKRIRLWSLADVDMENCYVIQYIDRDMKEYETVIENVTMDEAKKRAVEKTIEYFSSKVRKYEDASEKAKNIIQKLNSLAEDSAGSKRKRKPKNDVAKRPRKNNQHLGVFGKKSKNNSGCYNEEPQDWIYETGRDEPEILGSGSTYYNVLTTRNQQEAIEASKKCSRNYLIRFTPDRTRREVWTEEGKWMPC